ncbi:hypothetical protein C8F04DRAFT_1172980 [Mycena alexandri]|uniref:Uncharacterized protein n=1 Tax=Mycena alexandri TaxID=1745969 RepID=A0AAD6TKR0_9AGAR|nr:hypothetical protein C8F04DRAFT_1172980 [Mycena alexandri]
MTWGGAGAGPSAVLGRAVLALTARKWVFTANSEILSATSGHSVAIDQQSAWSLSLTVSPPRVRVSAAARIGAYGPRVGPVSTCAQHQALSPFRLPYFSFQSYSHPAGARPPTCLRCSGLRVGVDLLWPALCTGQLTLTCVCGLRCKCDRVHGRGGCPPRKSDVAHRGGGVDGGGAWTVGFENIRGAAVGGREESAEGGGGVAREPVGVSGFSHHIASLSSKICVVKQA